MIAVEKIESAAGSFFLWWLFAMVLFAGWLAISAVLSARRERRSKAPEPLRRTPFPVDVRNETQEHTRNITYAARRRQADQDHEGELAAERARTESWKNRCFEISRERDTLQAELRRLSK